MCPAVPPPASRTLVTRRPAGPSRPLGSPLRGQPGVDRCRADQHRVRSSAAADQCSRCSAPAASGRGRRVAGLAGVVARRWSGSARDRHRGDRPARSNRVGLSRVAGRRAGAVARRTRPVDLRRTGAGRGVRAATARPTARSSGGGLPAAPAARRLDPAAVRMPDTEELRQPTATAGRPTAAAACGSRRAKFASNPNTTMVISSEVPPAEIIGSGMPVTGQQSDHVPDVDRRPGRPATRWPPRRRS